MLPGARWLWESPSHPVVGAVQRFSGLWLYPPRCLLYASAIERSAELTSCFWRASTSFYYWSLVQGPLHVLFLAQHFLFAFHIPYFTGILVPSRWTCFLLVNADLPPAAAPLTFLQSHMGRVFCCSALCCKSCVAVAAVSQDSFESQHHFCLTPRLAVVIIMQSKGDKVIAFHLEGWGVQWCPHVSQEMCKLTFHAAAKLHSVC